MTAEELFRAGELSAAVEALGAELRADPMDARRRTFLFELLCFAGEYDRAAKQLDVLAAGSRDAEMGGLLYRSALHAEQTRQTMFASGDFPRGPVPPPVAGTLNGERIDAFTDLDPRIGARLEVFAAGEYVWIPFEHIAAVRVEPPTRLRDLMWAPAQVRTGPGFERLELGEVLLPVLAPLTWQHPDDAVRLGRVTEWVQLEDGTAVPQGQKLFGVNDEEMPILELRDVEITAAAPKAD